MSQSDKDFITRIQVSQLVTQDPYADDFYAQVYGAILRSRMGLQSDERVLKFGSGGGVGLGLTSQKGYRRPNAMQRMEQQVERIVSNARKREEEKGVHCECCLLEHDYMPILFFSSPQPARSSRKDFGSQL
jgi:DNA topoisomerase 2-associated protein PAT1